MAPVCLLLPYKYHVCNGCRLLNLNLDMTFTKVQKEVNQHAQIATLHTVNLHKGKENLWTSLTKILQQC